MASAFIPALLKLSSFAGRSGRFREQKMVHVLHKRGGGLANSVSGVVSYFEINRTCSVWAFVRSYTERCP